MSARGNTLTVIEIHLKPRFVYWGGGRRSPDRQSDEREVPLMEAASEEAHAHVQKHQILRHLGERLGRGGRFLGNYSYSIGNGVMFA